MEEFVGKRFGKLEVLSELPAVRDNSGSLRRWMSVKCDCGQIVDKKLKYLKNGDTTSCGNCVYEIAGQSAKGNNVISLEPFEDEVLMIGNKYQEWTVIEAGFRSGIARMLKSRCSCGIVQFVDKRALITGHSTSCGCYSRMRTSEVMSTHKMTDSRPYRIWANMRSRCNNVNTDAYLSYGGRGICHQASWSNFEDFWEDMKEGYSEKLELDRIDVNGNYTKENCRWAGGSLQAYNQRKHTNNTSGKTGVVLNKRTQNWVVNINVNKEKIYLGTFKSFDQAVEARENAEIKYYGELKGH